MWYAGNRGFRRAQIQLIYDIAPAKIQLSIGETTKEPAGLGADNKSCIPMIQGRVSAKLADKYVVGAYFMCASFRPDTDNTDLDFNASGAGVDFNLPLHKYLALKGEVNMGKNLNNCNLFNIAGSNSDNTDRNSLGIWMNATSKISDKFHVVAGYGMDVNQTDNLSGGAVENNIVIYGDLIFPMTNGFSIAMEFQSINTALKNQDNNSALVFILSGKISF